MASAKEEIIKFLQSLPETISSDEILYQLYVREEIKKGKKDIDEGRVLTEEEMDDLVHTWAN